MNGIPLSFLLISIEEVGPGIGMLPATCGSDWNVNQAMPNATVTKNAKRMRDARLSQIIVSIAVGGGNVIFYRNHGCY